jgi:hypothetical protein
MNVTGAHFKVPFPWTNWGKPRKSSDMMSERERMPNS